MQPTPVKFAWVFIAAAVAITWLGGRFQGESGSRAATQPDSGQEKQANHAPATVDVQLDPVGVEIADGHIANANDFWASGQFGLALTELDQAMAASPYYSEASRTRGQVVIAATAEAKRAEDETQRAIAQAEAARLQAFIATYDSAPPKGMWRAENDVTSVYLGGMTYFTQDDRRRAPNGKRWISMGVAVYNEGATRMHVNPGHFTLITKDGQTTPYDSLTFSWCATPLRAVDVQPGNNAQGCLVFLASSTSGPSKVIYSPGARNRQVVIDLERFPDRAG